MNNAGRWVALCGVGCLVVSAVWVGGNLREERRAAEAVKAQLQALRYEVEAAATEPEAVVNELKMEPPQETQAEAMEDDGGAAETQTNFLGVLSIPALGRELPVHASWSEALLKTAPCCYFGSPSEGLVIAGHNYRAHFRGLGSLKAGDSIQLTERGGKEWNYQVVQTEVLDGTDVEGMTEEGWDMTLFTCTGGGEKRVTVRCRKVE